MSRGIIYLITNKENGHKYVGQTTQGMNKRWQAHIQEAMRMSDSPLHRAMRKYGNHNFIIKEIDECDGSLLNEKEHYWTEKYKPEYNPPREEVLQVAKKAIQEYKPALEALKKEYKPWGTLTEENRGDGKHSGLRIRGKNLETGLCTDYENARMAALSLTGDPNKNGNILLAARKGGTAYGYKWQILEDKSKKKSVFSVNKKTEQMGPRYESIADAVRSLGGSGKGAGMIKSLRNPGRYSWKGYYWFYG